MNRQQLKHRRTTSYVLAGVLLAVLAAGCSEPSENPPPHANRVPETRLSNVPPPGTVSTSPLVSLSWLGDDGDGYVVAYRYRWSFQQDESSPIEYKPYTYILNIMAGGMVLVMMGDETVAPEVYKYFSTLPPAGLDTTSLGVLARGGTIYVNGVGLYASNPDDERYPVHESPSAGTFIFDSQDSLNPHVFEVSSIDNIGLVDNTPALLDFTTPLVPPPDVEPVIGPGFLDPATNSFGDTVIILNEFTDTYGGIVFGFQGYDPNSRTIEYSWIVDRDLWPPQLVEEKWSPFSLEPTARIKGTDMFMPESLTNHTIYIRGRNEFGSISTRGYFTTPITAGPDSGTFDTTWAHAHFQTVYPEFALPGAEQRILLINNTFNWDTLAVPPLKPARAELLQYYTDMYDALGLAGKYDIYSVPYNTSLSGTWPGLGVLAQYSLIHVMADVVNGFTRFPTISPGSQGKLINYCYAGGKLVINGWNITRPDNLPPSPQFWNNILHIQNQNPVTAPQFIGAYHQAIPDAEQYPDVPVDPLKLDTAWHGGMPFYALYQAYGFGEIIYRYDALNDNFINTPPGFPVPVEGGVVGIRYIGLTYDVIFFGLPLYYMEQPAAIEVLRRAFRDLNHL